MTAEIGLLLGEALHEVGTYEEADEVLSAAAAVATDEELLVYITEIQTRNLMWGMWRQREALDVNGAVCDRVTSRVAAEEMGLNRAMLLTYGGRPREALAVLEPRPAPTTARARSLHAFAELPALIAVGRCEAAVEGAERAYEEQLVLPEQIAIPFPGIHIVTQIYGLAECGRLAEATASGNVAYEQTPAIGPTRWPDVVRISARPLRVACRADPNGAAVAGRGAGAVRSPTRFAGRVASFCLCSQRLTGAPAIPTPPPRPLPSSIVSRHFRSFGPSRISVERGRSSAAGDLPARTLC